MRQDYTDREIQMLNTLLSNMLKINSFSGTIIKDMDKNTIVQIGNNAEEKLFLLNALLDDIIKENHLQAVDTSTLNNNVINLIESLKRILKEKDLVYTVSVPQIPGVEIPCSSLFEAKRVAKNLKFKANVLYNNQVIL
ncbi:MAG TPA: hypothetical protein PKK61_06070 [Defluviitaleaceae bacterium]|nr:hypothetical protein [Defluviitaleaceae bacterium]